MADNSPAFNPPLDRLIDDDPQIVKVPMDVVGMGFRKSQQGDLIDKSAGLALNHIRNGK